MNPTEALVFDADWQQLRETPEGRLWLEVLRLALDDLLVCARDLEFTDPNDIFGTQWERSRVRARVMTAQGALQFFYGEESPLLFICEVLGINVGCVLESVRQMMVEHELARHLGPLKQALKVYERRRGTRPPSKKGCASWRKHVLRPMRVAYGEAVENQAHDAG
jgi:hypothetical protein